jgi:hypothetical protein
VKEADLLATIDETLHHRVRNSTDLESTFVRLMYDQKLGRLSKIFARLNLSDEGGAKIRSALDSAAADISLPPGVIRRTPSISAHKQERLYQRLKQEVLAGRLHNLTLAHPTSRDAYDSYAAALKTCHEILLELDTSSSRLHIFRAMMAQWWMEGQSVPRIIAARIRRFPRANVRKLIRTTLETIESDIRFQVVRLFGCYRTILLHVLEEQGQISLSSAVPDVALFLEVGASRQTMLSLITLGLSRAASIRLSGSRSDDEPELGVPEALEWLFSLDLNDRRLGLSPLLRSEVEALRQKHSH